jgi:protein arginine kinase
MSEELTRALNADVIRGGVSWLTSAGKDSDVVISSRIRLARNLAGFPFLTRATRAHRQAIVDRVRARIGSLRTDADARGLLWVDVHQTPQADRTLMVERHLISKEHAKGDEPRGVAISLPDEQVSLMVNEEDQLRLQALRPGLQIAEAFAEINAIDDQLGCAPEEASEGNAGPLRYAFSPRFGFLTACPTNVGTGMRVSVMLHLPALRLTGEMEKVRRATKDMNLAVRGYYGEGSEATGELYQISNQTTLGKTEQVIMQELEHEILPQVIGYERKARMLMMEKRRRLLEDTVYRALGVLRHARLLTPEESLTLLSNVRLGLLTGLVNDISVETVNQLILLTQPAHLQRALGVELDQAGRREARADLVRERLGAK